MNIPTVRGAITPDEMGITFMHEHIFTPMEKKYHSMALDYAELELKNIALMGAKTLVDVGPWQWEKMDLYKEIASRVPELNIVCCTGYHWSFESSWYSMNFAIEKNKQLYEGLKDKDIDEMVEEIIKEITEGIMNSGVKAGVIKVGSNKPKLTPVEEKIFIAAGKAQAATGVPVCTHSLMGQLAQMEALEKGGANLEQVYYSHVECEHSINGQMAQIEPLEKAGANLEEVYPSHITSDIGWEGRSLEEEAEYLANIASKGGSLLFNNFHLECFTKWSDMIYLLKNLKDKGLSDRVLISMDWNFHINKIGQVELEDEEKMPDTVVRVPSYLFTWVIPALKKAGFTNDDIEQWLVLTPKRIFLNRKV